MTNSSHHVLPNPQGAQADAGGRLAEIFVTYQGEGPHVGKRQVFLRTAGCDVGCRYCDTPDALRGGKSFEVRRESGAASKVEIESNPTTAGATAAIVNDIAFRHAPIHAISITGGEPLEQRDFLCALAPLLAPHAILLETAGVHDAALEDVLRAARSKTIVSMDIKLPSVAKIAPQWDAHARFLDVALRLSTETYVKVIVNPQLDRADFGRAVRIVADRAPGVPFMIQPETDRRRVITCPFDFLFELADEAHRGGLLDVRVLPQVHKYLAAP